MQDAICLGLAAFFFAASWLLTERAMGRRRRAPNSTPIVIGKQAGPLWIRQSRGSVFDDVVARSGDMELIAISGEPETAGASSTTPAGPRWVDWREMALAAAVIALITAASLPMRGVPNSANLVMTQLRRKLEADPARPRHLRTEPGVGYRLVVD